MNAPARDQPGHASGDHAKAPPGGSGVRPVTPAIPSESGVGEEDPGDFENASIRKDDGKRPAAPQHTPAERRSCQFQVQPREVSRGCIQLRIRSHTARTGRRGVPCETPTMRSVAPVRSCARSRHHPDVSTTYA